MQWQINRGIHRYVYTGLDAGTERHNTDAEKHRETVADRHMQIDRQKQKHKHKKKETMEIDGNGERGI